MVIRLGLKGVEGRLAPKFQTLDGDAQKAIRDYDTACELLILFYIV